MDKDNKFYQALQIARSLREFIQGEDHQVDGCVRQFKFGVSESIVAVRAFYDQPDISDLAVRTEALYRTIRGTGETYLKVSVFNAGVRYSWDHTPNGSSSSETPDPHIPEGVLLRVDLEGKGDDFLKDRAAFREAVGPYVLALLQKDSSHPNVFFNAESCDFD